MYSVLNGLGDFGVEVYLFLDSAFVVSAADGGRDSAVGFDCFCDCPPSLVLNDVDGVCGRARGLRMCDVERVGDMNVGVEGGKNDFSEGGKVVEGWRVWPGEMVFGKGVLGSC